ncbi:hypothetical protein V2J09_016509 [Rumex salicifolius]
MVNIFLSPPIIPPLLLLAPPVPASCCTAAAAPATTAPLLLSTALVEPPLHFTLQPPCTIPAASCRCPASALVRNSSVLSSSNCRCSTPPLHQKFVQMAEGSNTPIEVEDYSDSDSSTSGDGEDQSQKITSDAASVMKASNSKAKDKTVAQTLPSKRKRERKAVALHSKVWLHFNKFDEPIFAEVDGVNKHVGLTKKAEC